MPAGRPTKLTADIIRQIEKLCSLGATDQEVADFFDVNTSTIWRWKTANEEFCKSLKIGKEYTDNRVERSLLSRATGYECDETDIRVIDGQVVQTTIRKQYPPDTVACIFWLKNRRPDLWRTAPVDGDDSAPPASVPVTRVDASIPDADA